MNWLGKTRKRDYICSNFVADVLECPLSEVAGTMAVRGAWKRITLPTENALVLMRNNNSPPHVGIYKNGGVLHLGLKVAMFQPMQMIERHFNRISFYARRNCNN